MQVRYDFAADRPSGRREWASLPPVQRVVSPIPPIAPRDPFVAALQSHRNPSFLAPLAHAVEPDVAGGLIGGLLTPLPRHTVHRQRADTTQLSLAQRIGRRVRGALPVLSRAFAADSGTGEPAGDVPADLASAEPASADPASDEPASDEPASDEPASDEPASDEPASDEPPSGDPAPEQPLGGAVPQTSVVRELDQVGKVRADAPGVPVPLSAPSSGSGSQPLQRWVDEDAAHHAAAEATSQSWAAPPASRQHVARPRTGEQPAPVQRAAVQPLTGGAGPELPAAALPPVARSEVIKSAPIGSPVQRAAEQSHPVNPLASGPERRLETRSPAPQPGAAEPAPIRPQPVQRAVPPATERPSSTPPPSTGRGGQAEAPSPDRPEPVDVQFTADQPAVAQLPPALDQPLLVHRSPAPEQPVPAATPAQAEDARAQPAPAPPATPETGPGSAGERPILQSEPAPRAPVVPSASRGPLTTAPMPQPLVLALPVVARAGETTPVARTPAGPLSHQAAPGEPAPDVQRLHSESTDATRGAEHALPLHRIESAISEPPLPAAGPLLPDRSVLATPAAGPLPVAPLAGPSSTAVATRPSPAGTPDGGAAPRATVESVPESAPVHPRPPATLQRAVTAEQTWTGSARRAAVADGSADRPHDAEAVSLQAWASARRTADRPSPTLAFRPAVSQPPSRPAAPVTEPVTPATAALQRQPSGAEAREAAWPTDAEPGRVSGQPGSGYPVGSDRRVQAPLVLRSVTSRPAEHASVSTAPTPAHDAARLPPPTPAHYVAPRWPVSPHASAEASARATAPVHSLPDPGAVAVAAGVAQRSADGTVVFGPQAEEREPEAAGFADAPAAQAPDVQRQEESGTGPGAAQPASPAPASAPSTVSTAAPAAAGAAPNIDDLVRRLYDPLAARLRAELRLDRERAGLITDLRRP